LPKEDQDFRGVSLKRELVEQVEKLVKENPQYKSIADFVHEAVRLRMQEVKKSVNLPRFEHFNINDEGVRITDRKIGMIADIYFKPQGIFCDLDKSNNCEHIDFALKSPEIQDIIRKKIKEGWKLPDV
jgi:Arc/MetJ-type ribon-helix-helix transcriptional regulator